VTALLIVAAVLAYLLVGFACARVLSGYGAIVMAAWLLLWLPILCGFFCLELPFRTLCDFSTDPAHRCAAWIQRKWGRS
jgi:hypothetical protein